MRMRILNLFDRTTCSTESGFFSVHCTPRLSTFRTWLLFRNSPYKCQLRLCCVNVQSLSNMSPDFLCYACTMKTDIFAVTENWFSQHDIDHRIKESPPRFKILAWAVLVVEQHY